MIVQNQPGQPVSFSTSAAGIPDLQELLWRLPAFDRRDPLMGREADYYGASKLIADELGLPITPISRSSWIHGWGPFQQWKAAPELNPAAIFGPRDPKRCHLLNTEEQVAYTATHGWTRCHAVGAPFTYTRPSGAERISGSLLVMPPHVTEVTEHDWDEVEYVKSLKSLRDRFSIMVACVSATCVAKNYWTGSLDEVGIPWIVGASPRDRNGLKRMRVLFDSFEFVTSNQLGSLHAYAALSGAKASVWGREQCYNKEQFKNDPMWQKYPEGLEVVLRESSHERSRERVPFLFCEPDQAVERVEWAQGQLGWDCRRDAMEMASLLGWKLPLSTNEDDLRLFLHSFTGSLAMKLYRLESFARRMVGRR